MVNTEQNTLLMIPFSFSGRPGTDYPILSAIPYTNFYCDEQPYPGFFADMDTRCQGTLPIHRHTTIAEFNYSKYTHMSGPVNWNWN